MANADRQLPGGLKTVNEEFFDAMVRHQIGLLRMNSDIQAKTFAILDATEEDMAQQIRRRLRNHSGLDTPAQVRRLNILTKVIRSSRLKAWEQVTGVWVEELVALANTEPVTVSGILKTVVPVSLETVIPASELLRSIVTTRPFQGKTLRQWAASVSRADIARIEGQIKIGMVQGETSQAIARRIVGTVAQRGRNGVTEISRRQATAITRTGINAIANQAKREFYQANRNLFTMELYTATLDNRTTPICQSLDGRQFPIGEGPYPPVHMQCRSLRVAIIDRNVIGNRPAKPSTERMLVRQFTRDRNISGVTSRARLPRGTKGDFDRFSRQQIRQSTGQVPAKVTYQQWLNRQSTEFQNDVLGPTRGVLFRKGELRLTRFVNRAGDRIPLSQLARTDAAAFRAAGLDPENFL